jgi:hypothetical protein
MTMQVGMLWYDDAPDRPLAVKLSIAARHYMTKYGRQPNICYLNQHTPGADGESMDGLRLKVAQDVLPHHFWIGVAE